MVSGNFNLILSCKIKKISYPCKIDLNSYKIGIIIEEPKPNGEFPNSEYAAYMYDDQFSPQRRDLTEYFYDEFMGLTTSENDIILSRNFYKDMEDLIEESTLSFSDKKGQKAILKSYFREENRGVIDPLEYGEQFVHPSLLETYKARMLNEYSHPFTKQDKLLERNLTRDHIILTRQLKLEGPIESVESVEVYGNPQESIEKIKIEVENGVLRV
jgi:hypothetical protein